MSNLPSYCSTGSNGANLPPDITARLHNAINARNSGAASTFTEDKALTIINSIIDGSTVRQACEKAGISRPTFYVWRSVVPGFLDLLTQAHELQADSMVDDNVQLLENVDVTSEDIDPRRLMASLRKAEQVARFKFDLAKCLNFNRYGDKKASLNINANAEISAVDLSAWLNK